MIPSKSGIDHLQAEEEWAGGGYGKYKGIPLKEIRARFATCEADPSMRSISAILRITREQLESRGQLGNYPVLAVLAAAASVVSALAWVFGKSIIPTDLQPLLWKASIVIAVLFGLLMIGVFRVRHARRSNLHQEQEIRTAAVASLNAVLAQNPKLKPLEREQVATVKELIKKVKPSGEIAQLLRVE